MTCAVIRPEMRRTSIRVRARNQTGRESLRRGTANAIVRPLGHLMR